MADPIVIDNGYMMSEFKRVYDLLMAGDAANQAIAASMEPIMKAYTDAEVNPTDVGFKTFEDLQNQSDAVKIVGANVGFTPGATLPPGTNY